MLEVPERLQVAGVGLLFKKGCIGKSDWPSSVFNSPTRFRVSPKPQIPSPKQGRGKQSSEQSGPNICWVYLFLRMPFLEGFEGKPRENLPFWGFPHFETNP